LQREQANMEDNLKRLMKKGTLNPKTEARLTKELNDLAIQEEGYMCELSADEDLHEKWKKAQAKLDEVHAICEEMLEKIRDPTYTAPYDKKRELVEFFHLRATIYKEDHFPRIEMTCDPDAFLSDLS
jgi:hypothetical protein